MAADRADAVQMLEETVAGFRIVRKLGSGSRADVYLGHASGTDRTVAVKVFHDHVPPESIAAELRALGAANHAHTVRLRDLSGGADGRPVLVLERLELGSLARLLAQRGALSAGEAVTILAPMAAAVTALQQSGVTHGAISAARVLFRESGAPVLSGFGHAAAGDPADLDRRALAALAATVLERVPGAAPLCAWLASLAAYPEGFPTQLADRVFALSAASPVRFAADGQGAEVVPLRTTTAAPVAEVEQSVPPARWFASLLARVPPRFRTPRWLAAAAGVLTVLVAIAVVPAGSGAAQAPMTPTAAPTLAPTGPVYGDDPVAAFGDLVEARNGCIHDLSILCLDTALQAGSAAMEDDSALIRAIERGEGAEPLLEPEEAYLAERMGDAALVDFTLNSEPASALLVKGEAGWRIRSYGSG